MNTQSKIVAATGAEDARPLLALAAGSEAEDHVVPASKMECLVFHPCPVEPACPYCGDGPASGGARDWSFLDGAYCVSLQSRPDRAASAAAELHRVGLCRMTLFHRPVKNENWPVAGIWEAHRAVAMHALASGRKNVLILEDDVVFSQWLGARKVRAIGAAMGRLPSDWMIFYLGHMSRWAFLVRRNVVHVSSTAAHAYIASPRLLTWLRDRPFGTQGIKRVRISGRGIDAAYARLPGTYAVFPLIATQSASPSDHIVRPGKELNIKKPKHLFTRTRYRELILSKAMRPAQYVALVASPAYFAIRKARRLTRRMARRLAKSATAT